MNTNNIGLIKALKVDRVAFTGFFASISAFIYAFSIQHNNVDLIHLVIPTIITFIYLLALKNTSNSIADFCSKYTSLILTMIVVTVFQTLSVWTYSEPKALIPESVQAMVLMVIPIFKWCVFIYCLNRNNKI